VTSQETGVQTAPQTAPVPPPEPAVAPAHPHQTRRRGEALQRAIFDAALEQLGALGYEKLTMEGIADAAGTGKAALYRRWDSKEDLVFAALADMLPDPAQVPVCDDVRADLLALLTCYRELYNVSHGAAFQVFKHQPSPDTNRLKNMVRGAVTDPLKAALREALARGVQRGEVRPGADTAQTANVGPAMMAYYCMTEEPHLPEGYVEHLVDDVLIPLVRA
jgi:AcrR family transcriptional regulator